MVYTVKSKQLPLMISPRTKSSPHLVLNDVDCANAATMNSMLPAMVRQFDKSIKMSLVKFYKYPPLHCQFDTKLQYQDPMIVCHMLLHGVMTAATTVNVSAGPQQCQHLLSCARTLAITIQYNTMKAFVTHAWSAEGPNLRRLTNRWKN